MEKRPMADTLQSHLYLSSQASPQIVVKMQQGSPFAGAAHARQVFAIAGYELELKPLAVFGAVEARWRDNAGETHGAIVAPSEQAACETALAKLGAEAMRV
jgi:hypothetical protein